MCVWFMPTEIEHDLPPLRYIGPTYCQHVLLVFNRTNIKFGYSSKRGYLVRKPFGLMVLPPLRTCVWYKLPHIICRKTVDIIVWIAHYAVDFLNPRFGVDTIAYSIPNHTLTAHNQTYPHHSPRNILSSGSSLLSLLYRRHYGRCCLPLISK